ncbi:hypothetical protein DPMN_144428 [Dreissena polymorpha]|uniref:Uncharacterized protein n=1 Tax=Dreissena polymorpha TaxID=45954 RepID=A0A9D4GFE6_DREPO|nr:hypothetical protein DPMN_144428 [Dreissena polymorpha]
MTRPWRPYIIGMNLLTMFHEDWTINVASKLKNAPPLGSHVFQAKIFELLQDINGTNLLSKFHEDRKINVASRVLTKKNAPPPGGHVFQPTGIIFKLVQDIIGINLLSMFYEDQTINVASRVKNAPPLGSHVFQANLTRQMLTPHNAQRTMKKKRSQKLTMSMLCSKTSLTRNGVAKADAYPHAAGQIDRIFIRDFQGSSAYSVGGDSGQDGRMDRQMAEITTISPHFKKSGFQDGPTDI